MAGSVTVTGPPSLICLSKIGTTEPLEGSITSPIPSKPAHGREMLGPRSRPAPCRQPAASCLAAQAPNTMRILSSAEKCRRVAADICAAPPGRTYDRSRPNRSAAVHICLIGADAGLRDISAAEMPCGRRHFVKKQATGFSPSRASRRANGNRSEFQMPSNACTKSSSGGSRYTLCNRRDALLGIARFRPDHHAQSPSLAEPLKKPSNQVIDDAA